MVRGSRVVWLERKGLIGSSLKIGPHLGPRNPRFGETLDRKKHPNPDYRDFGPERVNLPTRKA